MLRTLCEAQQCGMWHRIGFNRYHRIPWMSNTGTYQTMHASLARTPFFANTYYCTFTETVWLRSIAQKIKLNDQKRFASDAIQNNHSVHGITNYAPHTNTTTIHMHDNQMHIAHQNQIILLACTHTYNNSNSTLLHRNKNMEKPNARVPISDE